MGRGARSSSVGEVCSKALEPRKNKFICNVTDTLGLDINTLSRDFLIGPTCLSSVYLHFLGISLSRIW